MYKYTDDKHKNSNTDLLVLKLLLCLVPSPHFASLPVSPPLSPDLRSFHLEPLGTGKMPNPESRICGELKWVKKHS